MADVADRLNEQTPGRLFAFGGIDAGSDLVDGCAPREGRPYRFGLVAAEQIVRTRSGFLSSARATAAFVMAP